MINILQGACTFMSITVYIYIYIYIYIHTVYMYIYTHTHICVWMCVCVYTVYIYIYIYTHIHTHMHTHIYIHIHAHTRTHTHTYCDESAASPLIISTPRPLIAALHQAPDGSGCVREEGRCNSQVWRRVMRHTPEVNGASSPPLLYAGCASPLKTGLFPVHARWCPRGSRKGALRDRVPPKARAAGPAVRTRTAPARRPSGQDAGPTRPIECCRGPRGGRSRWKSRRPSRPGPRRGARAAAGLRPLPGPFLPEHLPLLHNPRSTTRTPDSPLLFWTLYSPWTLLWYYFV